MQKIIEFYYFNKKKIALSILFVITGIVCFAGIYFFNTMKIKADSISLELRENQENTDNFENLTLKKVDNSKEIVDFKYKVDIKGMVKKPGVYEVNVDSRVEDVISKAGGLLKEADTSVINLSKKISDEMVIIIYSKEQVKDFSDVLTEEEIVLESCIQNNGVLQNNACIDNNNSEEEREEESTLININTATIEQLQTLTGIGESKANAIIEYRNKNGKFKKIEDIKNVTGIGEVLFEKIKNNITI